MSEAERIVVIVTCRDQGRFLDGALESVRGQSLPASQVVVDDASTDVYSMQVLARLEAEGVSVVPGRGLGRGAAWNAGAEGATDPLLVFLEAEDRLHPTALERAAGELAEHPQLGLVAGGRGDDEGQGAGLLPRDPDPWELLAQAPLCRVAMVRRSLFEDLRGFDSTLTPYELLDFWIGAAQEGHSGLWEQAPLLLPRERIPSPQVQRTSEKADQELVAHIFDKHQGHIEAHWQEVLLGRERALLALRSRQEHLNGRRVELEARLEEVEVRISETALELEGRGLPVLSLGDLDRKEPLSPVWGLDRGVPVDRYYIADFLNRHRTRVMGRVLEVKEPVYTEMFGDDRVLQSDVLDVFPDNPRATIVADLCTADVIPDDTFDCFLLTQTLNILYDVRGALAQASRVLKPGGALLCTVSALNRISYEDRGLDGDYWRFTEASLRELFAELFPPERFEITGFGNVLTCSAFLYGLAHQELSREQLDRVDPFFPLLYGVLAEKP